jgi:glycosyltransferase involved in cell wall biosynthesis
VLRSWAKESRKKSQNFPRTPPRKIFCARRFLSLVTAHEWSNRRPVRIGLSTSVIGRGKTGIGQYVFALTRALLAQEEPPQLVLFVLEEDVPLFEFTARRAEIVPVPERYRSASKNILWHQTMLPRLARKLKLDVLHVPSYRRMLWRTPCPLVATIHDLAPFHVADKYDWKRMFYGRVIARRLAQRQNAIIAISANTGRDIQKFFGVPSEKIAVVYNGIEHERFFPGSAFDAKAAIGTGYDLNNPFFLYVARLEHPGKNHVRLVEAFDRFKKQTKSEWQLALAGSDWTGADVIHAAIKQSPFATDIRVLGFVSDAELPTLYRAADAFVYPSLYEGFGMPPIEAMACGCPVISSTRGALAEVVGEAASLINPEDIDDISSTLASMAGSLELRKTWRKAGLAQAKKFNWQRTAQETLAVCERVARR